MKRLSIYFISAVVLLACAGQKKSNETLAESAHPAITRFDPQLLTSQDMYPGTYFNLKKVRTYRTIVRLSAAKAADASAFLTDSVRLPVSRMLINGDEKRMPFPALSGSELVVEMETTRNFYQENAPKTVEEEPASSSGKNVPNGEVWLELVIENDTLYRSLGKVTTLDPLRGR
jgi:hypothetical protein